MGNNESQIKEGSREAHTQALLAQQRKFYEEKCQRLLEQVQTSRHNQTRVEQTHVRNSSGPSNTLYPNLNMAAASGTHSTSHISNMPAAHGMNNCNPSNIPSTPINNNMNICQNPANFRTMVMPSAPPEPSAPSQQEAKEKRLRPVKNPNVGKEYCCETCGEQLGLIIFQCTDGHSSCEECRKSGRRCGKDNCRKKITDIRNRVVEHLIAELALSNNTGDRKPTTTKSETKMGCPNQPNGCKLHFTKTEMANHLKECLFSKLICPLASIFGTCHWLGRINQLVHHFTDRHPEHRQADVDTEMTMLDAKNPSMIVHLVSVGRFSFLVNIKVDTIKRSVFLSVQYFGTGFGAAKWTYEFHIYNKSQPRRKYFYSDVCQPNFVSTEDIFKNNTCAVIPVSYFETFQNNGSINYKFYIKKLAE